MKRSLKLCGAVTLLFASAVAHGQEGAPLITGLGGPFDVGPPVLEDHTRTDTAPAFPDGIRLYADPIFHDIYANWEGSLSPGRQDTFTSSPIPKPRRGPGPVAPRFVPYGMAVALFGFGGEDQPISPMFLANLPPDPDGTPGRLIATWYRVRNHPESPGFPPQAYNTFQLILTAGPDPANYDIELRYALCSWTYSLLQVNAQAAMGFDGGQGSGGPGWEWGGSRSDDMLLLCELSNVREPGIYRYRVVDGIPTGCGIDADPPPGEGRCADGNHLPGDGCSPACYVEPDVDEDGVFEAPYPEAPDPQGVYDDCLDVDNPDCNGNADGDGIPPHRDNCPEANNPEQFDYDGDDFGDACDPDPDFDSMEAEDGPVYPADLCPLIYSRSTRRPDPALSTLYQQSDIDGDDLGDACDPDDDGDGILDCGGDGICHPDDDGYNNDFDNFTDEGEECGPDTNCHHGARDFFDNDADGFVDEASEIEYAFVEWPGRDLPPSLPEDNCRRIPNADQTDSDGDGIGDACDADIDGDGVDNCVGGICGPWFDGRDNDRDDAIDEAGECEAGCPADADAIDQDMDGWVDEVYEVEQGELDGWQLPAALDNCPRVANETQADFDGDGLGDACDDSDADGFLDDIDNCPAIANDDQADTDGDSIGDVCDDDRDGDGILNGRDGCPDTVDSGVDTDDDGIDDICDPDDDDDGVNDVFDRCPLDFDPAQIDLDGDGTGDVCDADDDGDGIDDDIDDCPRQPNGETDNDQDGLGDLCDTDDDDDGVADERDVCPLVADPDQHDIDGDGIGDACDPTDDRPFEVRTPEEKCALLIADEAPTVERLRHCPPPADDGCSVTPGGGGPTPWIWMLLGLGLRRRS